MEKILHENHTNESPDKPQTLVQETPSDDLPVRLKELPVDWTAIRRIGELTNELLDMPITRNELGQINPPPKELNHLIPVIASQLAHHKDPEISIVEAKFEDVKKLRPKLGSWLTSLEWLLTRISPELTDRFHKYVEKLAINAITGAPKVHEPPEGYISYTHPIKLGTNYATKILDEIGVIDKPRDSFVAEIAGIYNYVATPEEREDFFGNVYFEHDVEGRIKQLGPILYRAALFGEEDFVTSEKFPILTKILPFFRRNLGSDSSERITVVATEFIGGIHEFLKMRGVRNLSPAPETNQFNPFSFNSWLRVWVEIFKPDVLERIKSRLPRILNEMTNALPANGQEFSDKVYQIARNIALLHNQKIGSEEIAKRLFQR